MELGDFLDTMFFDTSNPYATGATMHFSFLTGLVVENNTIDMPPTPNPPPLTLPIGMRAVDILMDQTGMIEDGAFVIMGKEVFTIGVHNLWTYPYWPMDTGFVHLQPAELVDPPTGFDEPFPPNACPGRPYWADFVNTGPVAQSCTVGFGFTYAARQQIGNFLFSVDKNNNEVKVINSNTMDLITSISGFSSPDSAAVSGDLKRLYVTNSGSGVLSVFNADPRSSEFLHHITDIQVGIQPKGLCYQPDHEDVLVCNYGSDSISIVDVKSATVRKTITSLLDGPWDLVAGPRQTTFGYRTGIYHAYVSNYGGDNVLVFESGPSGNGGIGYDDILDPVPETGEGGITWLPMEKPRGICWDPHFYAPNYLNGGAFVAHKAGSYPVVSRISFTKQQAPLGPIYLQPFQGAPGGTPGFGKRIFEITAQWGGPDNPLSVGSGAATDVALLDYNREFWCSTNWTGNPYVTNYGAVANNPEWGMPINHKHPTRILQPYGLNEYHPVVLPDRLYISFEFEPVIDVIDPIDGTMVKTITGLPAPAKVLKTYFKY
jgi:YVTN family beta-propeller protein